MENSENAPADSVLDDQDVERQHIPGKLEHDSSSLLYRVEDIPPLPSCIALALQQFLYVVGSIASYPVILMPILCYEDSQNVKEYRTIIASNCVLITGLSTILQTTFGSRLPTIQATSITYFVAALSVFNSDKWSCPTELTSNITSTSATYISSPTPFQITDGWENVNEVDKVYVEYDGTIRSNQDVWMTRMRLIQGSVIICGLVQIGLGATGAIGYLSKHIGPLTIAPVLTMLTYKLCDVILNLCQSQWAVAAITAITFYTTSVLLENIMIPIPQCIRKGKRLKLTTAKYPIFAMFPVLYSAAVGWLAYYLLSKTTKLETSVSKRNMMDSVPWFALQYPLRYGNPIFAIEGIVGLMVAVIPTTLEGMGHFVATSVICHLPPTPSHAENRAILFQGISATLFGMFGVGAGSTFWTSNSAVIAMSRAGSRRIYQYAGLMMIVVSIFPKTLSIFALMPEPVIGGLLLPTIGSIFAVGMSSIQRVAMHKNRNLFVLGFSVIAGIIFPKYFTKKPESVLALGAPGETILILLQSPMLVSGVAAFVLDNISPGSKRDRGLGKRDQSSGRTTSQTPNSDVYDLPFKTNYLSMTRHLPFCPSYKRGTLRCCGVRHRVVNIMMNALSRRNKEDSAI